MANFIIEFTSWALQLLPLYTLAVLIIFDVTLFIMPVFVPYVLIKEKDLSTIKEKILAIILTYVAIILFIVVPILLIAVVWYSPIVLYTDLLTMFVKTLIIVTILHLYCNYILKNFLNFCEEVMW